MMGHSAASSNGAKNKDQPGNKAPEAMRTVNSNACAVKNKGSTCMACEGTVNHSNRRWIMSEKNPNAV
jgi:hypothetical protein